jgi:hypothetical protein
VQRQLRSVGRRFARADHRIVELLPDDAEPPIEGTWDDDDTETIRPVQRLHPAR